MKAFSFLQIHFKPYTYSICGATNYNTEKYYIKTLYVMIAMPVVFFINEIFHCCHVNSMLMPFLAIIDANFYHNSRIEN